MKKLLLSTAAVGLALAATPAHAQVSLDVGGHLKGYVAFNDQDVTTGGDDANDVDILRETEVHLSGETTLDNGLTVGVHIEADVDGGTSNNDSFDIDESYAYFSGSWGRVNFGVEDGAAYLLQVAAPSADDNVDGLRQYVRAENYALTPIGTVAGLQAVEDIFDGGLDYDNDFAGTEEKVTYLSPIFSGFQVGASYTPDADGVSNALGSGTDNTTGAGYGEVIEVAARYEGQFENVGVILGAGYTDAERDDTNAATQDDFQEWNVGLDLDFGPIGVGAVYTENNNADDTDDVYETFVLGADYTTGAFKLGASYFNNETDAAGATSEVETDRYSFGVVYSYGPGMTFRGSVHQVEHEIEGQDDVDSTSFLVGTQINF